MSGTKKLIFRGAATAVITPFSSGEIDLCAMASITRRQLDGGVGAIVVCGTTGEAPTLTSAEKASLIYTAAKEAAGRIPVIAGVGSNNTAAVLKAVRDAAASGADAVMTVTPYYNKPTEEGIIAHFTAVADASPVPVIIYNVPSRTGVTVTPKACRVLARHENVAGLKEASGTLSLISFCVSELKGSLPVYVGCDELTLPALALGADGVISVTSNIRPRDVSELCRLFFAGDVTGARAVSERLRPLTEALFTLPNPIPVKAAASYLGLCKNELRLPLLPMSENGAAALYEAMAELGS